MTTRSSYGPKSHRRARGIQKTGVVAQRMVLKRTNQGGRPRRGDLDVDEPPESPKHYSPEQVLALHVFWQAIVDVQTSSLIRARERLTAAQFLAGVAPFNVMQAFWSSVLGLDAKAAREQAMQKHGTAIARVLTHGRKYNISTDDEP